VFDAIGRWSAQPVADSRLGATPWASRNSSTVGARSAPVGRNSAVEIGTASVFLPTRTGFGIPRASRAEISASSGIDFDLSDASPVSNRTSSVSTTTTPLVDLRGDAASTCSRASWMRRRIRRRLSRSLHEDRGAASRSAASSTPSVSAAPRSPGGLAILLVDGALSVVPELPGQHLRRRACNEARLVELRDVHGRSPR
jgi:hypothetical protein